jgi:hypothetical protein
MGALGLRSERPFLIGTIDIDSFGLPTAGCNFIQCAGAGYLYLGVSISQIHNPGFRKALCNQHLS